MAEKYNGWTNYETWNVALWLDNEQGSQRYWAEKAQAAFDEAGANETFSRAENATHALGKQLKLELDDEMNEAGVPELHGFYADLLNAALSEVNWHEIAEHYLAEVDQAAASVEAD